MSGSSYLGDRHHHQTSKRFIKVISEWNRSLFYILSCACERPGKFLCTRLYIPFQSPRNPAHSVSGTYVTASDFPRARSVRVCLHSLNIRQGRSNCCSNCPPQPNLIKIFKGALYTSKCISQKFRAIRQTARLSLLSRGLPRDLQLPARCYRHHFRPALLGLKHRYRPPSPSSLLHRFVTPVLSCRVLPILQNLHRKNRIAL